MTFNPAEWANKLILTIDNSKVDADLTDFPVLIALSSGTGINNFDATDVFDELSTVSGTKRISITTTISGIETELYTEIERWDWENEQAWLWTKVPTIVSGTDTTLNFYYDSTQTTNSGYIGDTGDTAAKEVWNDDFVGVWHMAQDPDGDVADCILDSTASGIHGTPAGTMTTADLVDGKVGKAIEFDNINDCINCGADAELNFERTDSFSIEAIFQCPPSVSYEALVCKAENSNNYQGWHFLLADNGKLNFLLVHDNSPSNMLQIYGTAVLDDSEFHGVVVTYDGTSHTDGVDFYVDGAPDAKTSPTNTLTLNIQTALNVYLGGRNGGSTWPGILDSIRISSTIRSPAWIKATYNSYWDSLITFNKGWFDPADWANKLILTIDSSKIDQDLTDFPVLVTLSSGTGINDRDVTQVFDELESNANRKKIALTTMVSGVETELYTEIERWDHSNEEAYLWTKVPTIVSGTDTELYLYYDANHADNIIYIGDTGEAPAQNVWDDDFVGVWHMAQDPNGDVADCILDSTSNAYNGTPAGTMTTDDLVDSRIGKGIDFDGANDKITEAPCYTHGTNNWCVEAIINTTTASVRDELVSFGDATTIHKGFHSSVRSGKLAFDLSNAAGTVGSIDVNDGSDHYVVFQNISNTISIYSDTVFDTSKGMSPNLDNNELCFANLCESALDKDYDGIIDEVRISKIYRSSAWQKATYYSNWNGLITFSEGIPEVIFIFSNPMPAHLSTVYGTSQVLQLTVTISGEDSPYIYDATFYDATTSGTIGSTVSGTNSGEFVSTVMQTPSGVDYSWYLYATSSGENDTSIAYTFTNKFKCAGTVKEGETALSGIPVRLYKRDTGELVGYTTSTGISGTFEIVTGYNEYHYAVALYASTISGVDTTETNALIYDWLKP